MDLEQNEYPLDFLSLNIVCAILSFYRIDDYYNIFEVDRHHVTNEEIESTFNKMSLLDINSYNIVQPVIYEAKEVLTDGFKRLKHDLFGKAGLGYTPQQVLKEIDKILEVYRVGYSVNQRLRTRRNRDNNPNPQEEEEEEEEEEVEEEEEGERNQILNNEPNISSSSFDPKTCKLVIIVLSILFVGYYMFAIFIHYNPLYSLEQSTQHRFPRKTQNLKLDYYLKAQYYSMKRIIEIEETIERNFLTNLKTSCDEEVNKRDYMIWKARHLNDREMFRNGHYMKISAECYKLPDLEEKLYRKSAL